MSGVLVTGATGFLGGAVARQLARAGVRVYGLGRDAEKGARLARDGVAFIACDLSAADPIHLPPIEAVVHAAALSSPWGTRAAFLRANVAATERLLAAFPVGALRRFVLVSTPSVYFRFRDQLAVGEDAPLPAPVNAYAATKRAAERLVLARPDLSPVVLRPRGLYGPGDTSLVPRLLRAARQGPLPLMRGGRAVTDPTHISDAVAAVEAALAAGPAVGGRVFNVSGGEAVALKALAERAAAAAGVAVRWRPVPTGLALGAARALEAACALAPGRPEPRVTAYTLGLFAYSQTLDVRAARDGLGWAPRMSIAEGLAQTLACPAGLRVGAPP